MTAIIVASAMRAPPSVYMRRLRFSGMWTGSSTRLREESGRRGLGAMGAWLAVLVFTVTSLYVFGPAMRATRLWGCTMQLTIVTRA